jgi:hypothetical protein
MTTARLADSTSPTVTNQIVADNIRAAGIVYFAARLEELKLFQVADRLAEKFQQGLLPINGKTAGRGLYEYYRRAPLRIPLVERVNLYSRVLGQGGSGEVATNRDFDALWIRFVSEVSSYARQASTRPRTASATEFEQRLRAAGRDLAVNLARHGSGPTWFAATELRKEVDQILTLLGSREIQSAFSSRDTWQLIEQVSVLELGGAANSQRYRTQANAGVTIISWLAKNTRKLTGKAPVLKLRATPANRREIGVITNPSDNDLVNACEKWLAVAGTPDGQIDDLSQRSGRDT